MTNDVVLDAGILAPDDADVATPFELWCERESIRPDAPGAIETFTASATTSTPD